MAGALWKTRVSTLLGIDYPIIQAGLPWVSGPELAAAVCNAGALGVIHPSAGMSSNSNLRTNLREQIKRLRSLTTRPFGVALFLNNPAAGELAKVMVDEVVPVVVTVAGSPALHTGLFKDRGVTVLHLVGSVRHAIAAESVGCDAVIAEGFEGGGLRSPIELPTFVLVPQVKSAVDIPVIASGGIADGRGYVAARALGAEGVYMGTRFTATSESLAHPRLKEAIAKAVDSDTVVIGRGGTPARVLRWHGSSGGQTGPGDLPESRLSPENIRKAFLEGDLKRGIAYCGASAGLITEVLGAAQVIEGMVREAGELAAALK